MPSICGVGVYFPASPEQNQNKGSGAIGALSDSAEGNRLSDVYGELCAAACAQVFHDCMFKSQYTALCELLECSVHIYNVCACVCVQPCFQDLKLFGLLK